MPQYNQSVGRTDVQPLSPEQILADAIIQALPEASLVLGAGPRRVTLARAAARMPVLSVLPEAYFVSGDTGLKETTRAAWINKYISVEELAVIVPIPDSVTDDTDLDVFTAIKPLVVEAVGAKIDSAVLFGNGKPGSWDFGGTDPTQGLAQAAEASGNVQHPTGGQSGPYKDLVAGMRLVAADGHPITAFAADSLYEYDLLNELDAHGRPLFTPAPTVGAVPSLLGRPFLYLNNGAWDSAWRVIAGDFRNLIVGIRRDISWEVFREGVITDDTGKVLFNLMQQDSRALRMTMRLGITVGNPKRRRSKDAAHPYPFSVLKAS